MVGRLIPAGTGMEFHRERHRRRDERRQFEEAWASGKTVDEVEETAHSDTDAGSEETEKSDA